MRNLFISLFSFLFVLHAIHIDQSRVQVKRSLASVDNIGNCLENTLSFANPEVNGNSLSYTPRDYPVSNGNSFATSDIDKLIIEGAIDGGGKYKIIQKLGEGGQANVFEVNDVISGNRLAIKLSMIKGQGQLVNETAILKELEHPNIVNLVSSGDDYIVMEDILGISMRDYIEKLTYSEPSSQEFNSFLDKMIKLKEVVDFIHSNSIVHLDIKPENIMFLDNGEIKLIDFGNALKTDKELGNNLIYVSNGFSSPWQMDASLGQLTKDNINFSNDYYSIKATFLDAYDKIFKEHLEEILQYEEFERIDAIVKEMRVGLRNQDKDSNLIDDLINALRIKD